LTDPLHIGFLAADLTHRHGWAHYSLSLLAALSARGVQVTALAPHNSPAPDLPGVQVHRVLPSVEPIARGLLASMLRLTPSAVRLLRGCDLIHAAVEPFAPLAAACAAGRPLVVTGHGSYVRASQMRRFPANVAYRAALRRGVLACVSHYTEAQARLALGDDIRTVVIPNGVDVARFAGVRHDRRDDGEIMVLCVGAVKARKGTLQLARALAAARDRISVPLRCVIAGSLSDAAYAAHVRDEIVRLGAESWITLPGRVPDADLLALYEQADIFALPSVNAGWRFEGFGLALLEASAAGLPVIGSRDCGAEDAVEDGVTGLLVPQDADLMEDALAGAIMRLAGDAGLRLRMGEAGRARAARMTWDHTAAKLIALYEQLLAGK
jgi:glycosyltransferase involved in cell wall biosynthesis